MVKYRTIYKLWIRPMSFDDHIIYLCPGYIQFPLVSVASSISPGKKRSLLPIIKSPSFFHISTFEIIDFHLKIKWGSSTIHFTIMAFYASVKSDWITHSQKLLAALLRRLFLISWKVICSLFEGIFSWYRYQKIYWTFWLNVSVCTTASCTGKDRYLC